MDTNKNQSVFRTENFYAASVLVATGEKIVQLQEIGHGKVSFIFDTPPHVAEKTINAHYDRLLRLPSLNLIEAIQQLKSRLYQRLQRGGEE